MRAYIPDWTVPECLDRWYEAHGLRHGVRPHPTNVVALHAPELDPDGSDEPTLEVTRDWLVTTMAQLGHTDPAIARALDMSPQKVRQIRRRAGIKGNPYTSPWRSVVTALWAQGATREEIAEATGYTVGTVREYLSRLRLPSRR